MVTGRHVGCVPGEGDVQGKVEDELDTIDARGPAPGAPGAGEAMPLPKPSPQLDHPALLAVERRHYAISGEIAKGGMGRVLAARDLRLGRSVAIKELLPRNRDLARRFEREARITARLQHPAIIHVNEAGVWNSGEPFYAMTKVSGRSLDKVIAELPTLNERLSLLPNVIAVVDALAYAHSENVIHRDLKPANILVGEFGETVVIDWGLAKDLGLPNDPVQPCSLQVGPDDTDAGSIVGTPAYMPPEQASGQSVDQRADVYALGAVLYHVLVGSPPYSGATAVEVLQRVIDLPCVPVRDREPGAPPDLIAIVAKAMARDPGDRYRSARELAQDLKRFQTGQLVAAHHYTPFQLFWRWLRRRRLAVGVGGVAAVVLVVGATLSISRILGDKRFEQLRRDVLLEDRGRAELLAGHHGRALAYLAAALHGDAQGALGFMIAEAARPFDAQIDSISSGDRGKVVVAYSPDGRRVATAGVGSVQIRDGQRTTVLAASIGLTRVIAFDRSGERVVTAGDDKVARVWSVSGGSPRLFVGHTDAIIDAEFSEDGQRIATASADGTARVWNIAAGTSLALSYHSRPVVSVRFSPGDGSYVATASEDSTACVWSASDGLPISPLRGHSDAVNTVRWSLDGVRVLTASADGTARVWDPILGKPVIKPIAHEPHSRIVTAEFSSDGHRIVTAGTDRTARIWQLASDTADAPALASATLIATLGHAGGINAAAFSADGALVATAGQDSVAKVWDASTGQLVLSFEHAGVVETLAFNHDGSRLVTGSRDGTTQIWDVSNHDERGYLQVDSPVRAIAVARHGELAAGRDDSRVTVAREGVPTVLFEHLGTVRAVAYSPDGSRLVTASDDGNVFVWASGKRLLRLVHDKPVRSIAISTSGEVVFTACEDGRVRSWSMRDGTRIGEWTHTVALSAVAPSPTGDLLVALDDDGQVVVWRGAAQLDRRKRTESAARALAFSHDGRRLVVSGATDAQIFAVGPGAIATSPLVALDGALQDVRVVAFTTDDSRVITGGGDGLAKMWDAAKGKLLGIRNAHGTEINSLATSADGKTLWAGSERGDQGFVRAWDIHVETRTGTELRALLHARVPWRLDEDVAVRQTGELRELDGQH
jgi:WD40 repeat protein